MPAFVAGRLHALLKLLLEGYAGVAGDELLAGMIGASQSRVSAGVRQDHLIDHFFGQVLARPLLVKEDVGGGRLLGLYAEFDDRFETDPKAVLGGKADVLQVVSLTAAIDQTHILYVRI